MVQVESFIFNNYIVIIFLCFNHEHIELDSLTFSLLSTS